MTKIYLVIAVSFILISSAQVNAVLIDFENIPNVGTPTEGLTIDNQFLATTGVSFSLEGGGAPVIAQVGGPTTAFGPNDSPFSDQGVGQFFLTDDGVVVGNPKPLLITYATPTAAASGVILDIDGETSGFPEIYTVEARDGVGTVLESVVFTAGDFGTGDRLATTWSFSRATNEIASIRIIGFREGNRNVGLAFDNFDTSSAAVVEGTIPEPSAAWLFILGMTVLAASQKKK